MWSASANEGTCLHILPEVFGEFKTQYPDVNVSISRAEHNGTLESIINNPVDFGVVSLPVNDNRLTVVPIHKDELVIIAAPGHVLAKKKHATVAETAEFPLLMPKLGRTRKAIENLFAERRLKANTSMELDSSELLKRFVAAGVGVGFIPAAHVQEDVRANVLCAIGIADANILRNLALVFRKGSGLEPGGAGFHRDRRETEDRESRQQIDDALCAPLSLLT